MLRAFRQLEHKMDGSDQNMEKKFNPELRMDSQDQQIEMKFSISGDAGALELCVVCGDRASGRHYGAISCEGCKGFFKRSIRKDLNYTCRGTMTCEVTKHHRNRCQFCRLQKCLRSGMKADSVQHERKPMVDKMKNEVRESSNANVHEHQPHPYQFFGLSGQQTAQRHPTEEQSDTFTATSPAAQNMNFLAAAVALNSNNVAPYLHPTNSVDVEAARRQKLNMLQIQLAKNLFKMGQFGTINDYLSACAALPMEGLRAAADSQQDDVELILSTSESLVLNIEVPPPAPPQFFMHVACELAARLLKASFQWMLSIPATKTFSFNDQATILKNCWSQLLVLGLVKYGEDITLSSSLPLLIAETETILQERADGIEDDIPSGNDPDRVTSANYSTLRIVEVRDLLIRLQQFLNRMQELHVTEKENAFLRALCLFSLDGAPESISEKVLDCQNKVLRSFKMVCQIDDERMSNLLLQLPALRSFTGSFIEDVFFVGVIGDVNVSEQIPDFLKELSL